jgi:hypothetical protein
MHAAKNFKVFGLGSNAGVPSESKTVGAPILKKNWCPPCFARTPLESFSTLRRFGVEELRRWFSALNEVRAQNASAFLLPAQGTNDAVRRFGPHHEQRCLTRLQSTWKRPS